MTDTWGTREWGVRQRRPVEDGECGEAFVAEYTEAELTAVLRALERLT